MLFGKPSVADPHNGSLCGQTLSGPAVCWDTHLTNKILPYFNSSTDYYQNPKALGKSKYPRWRLLP